MSSASPGPLPAWPVDTLDVAGAQLAVRRAEPTRPDAEPALYVHGLGGSATNWTDLMGLLRDRVDGEALDLPGFGFSPPPEDGDFSPEGHARTVVALLEHRDRGPVHLFGNSLGGAVATLVAARRPDLVRTLTLVSPAMPDLRPRRHTLPMALMWLPVFGEAAQRYLTGLPPEKRMEGILELCFADPTAVPEPRRIETIEEIRRRNGLPYAGDAALASLRGLVSAYVAPTTRSPWAAARQITVPTLVLYGREDRLVRWRQSRRAARTYPGARVVVLPGCGHVAQMERPDLIATAWRNLPASMGGQREPASRAS
jgi:pimeloyl-ACP methyl ester carboxylesterase